MRSALLLVMFVGFQTSSAATFDVNSVVLGASGTAIGTSDGVAFSLSPTYIWDLATVVDGSSLIFSNATYHNPPLPTSDVLHIGFESFTLTFSQPISSALIYLHDNPPDVDSALDFGITPIVLSGDIATDGTKFRPTTPAGGLVRLDSVNSLTLAHSATGASGGLDFAIIVTAVPEPNGAMLLGIGATVLIICRRKSVPLGHTK